MSNILQFKKPSLKKKAKETTLCSNGFHKWEVVTENQFDTRSGKLVTAYYCPRCGKKKTKAH
ncbi:MAG: hypothetical protein COB61_001775 [Thiotrichales bacterium]|nr:hypothetical protein [Thiotrichales bacterium]